MQEAAGLVVAAVNDGIEAGEVTGGIGEEISHKIDEILRELDEDGDVQKSVEKVDDLREKVFEALEKGEITSAARGVDRRGAPEAQGGPWRRAVTVRSPVNTVAFLEPYGTSYSSVATGPMGK